MKTSVRFLLCAVYAIIILWLALMPAPPSIPGILGWDKLLHAGAFLVFTLLAGWALLACTKRAWRWALLASAGFGILIEVLQGLFTTTRSADPFDLLADLVGAGTVFLLIVIRERYRMSKTRHKRAC
jgi:VanZ family protein